MNCKAHPQVSARTACTRCSAPLGARLVPSVPFFTFVGVWVDNVGALTLIGVAIGAGVAYLIPATGQLG